MEDDKPHDDETPKDKKILKPISPQITVSQVIRGMININVDKLFAPRHTSTSKNTLI